MVNLMRCLDMSLPKNMSANFFSENISAWSNCKNVLSSHATTLEATVGKRRLLLPGFSVKA